MNARPNRVLVIDDEPPIRKLLRTGLSTQGYTIAEAPSARVALLELERELPDLVILDLGLPDMPGHDLLRRIREAHAALPVIILSSREDESGKVEALDLGADDYVTKPFGMNELLARMRTVLRHRFQSAGERSVFRAGDLSVDLVRRIVRRGETDIRLTPREYDLLRAFVQHSGKVLTHAQILKAVWGDPMTDAQLLRVYVRQLRMKIESNPAQPRYLITETGIGYRFLSSD